jgi:pimeloyl-ACP methyl ester carboxylesterase
VGDVLAVLENLGVASARYLGASMGAAIGLEVARRAPEGLRSLTLFGYGRYGPPTELQRRFQTMGRQLEETAVAMGAEAAWAAFANRGPAAGEGPSALPRQRPPGAPRPPPGDGRVAGVRLRPAITFGPSYSRSAPLASARSVA